MPPPDEKPPTAVAPVATATAVAASAGAAHISSDDPITAAVVATVAVAAVVVAVAPAPVVNAVTATANAAAGQMDKHAIPEWRWAHRLWSVQISVFWAIVCGLWVALPAFQNWMHPVTFALLCVGFSLAILVARLTDQKGIPSV